MDYFDFKCGHCGTVFSVRLSEYRKRIDHISVRLSEYRKRIDHIENPMRLIRCPSCCSILPPPLRDYVKQILDTQPRSFENWSFGTRLHETHRCVNHNYNNDYNSAADQLLREFNVPRNR